MAPDGQSWGTKSLRYLQNSYGTGSGTLPFLPLSPSAISLMSGGASSGGRGRPRACASSKKPTPGPPVEGVGLGTWCLAHLHGPFPRGHLRSGSWQPLKASAFLQVVTIFGAVAVNCLYVHQTGVINVSDSSTCGNNVPFWTSSICPFSCVCVGEMEHEWGAGNIRPYVNTVAFHAEQNTCCVWFSNDCPCALFASHLACHTVLIRCIYTVDRFEKEALPHTRSILKSVWLFIFLKKRAQDRLKKPVVPSATRSHAHPPGHALFLRKPQQGLDLSPYQQPVLPNHFPATAREPLQASSK